ncbi:hypothetical protein F5Y16DRAFT_80848 [Xylariaceae sp. FL0255]|nr:hypothetical protein F5Y16DRAFT_80848 [Xylariaceae sp. FL0255]
MKSTKRFTAESEATEPAGRKKRLGARPSSAPPARLSMLRRPSQPSVQSLFRRRNSISDISQYTRAGDGSIPQPFIACDAMKRNRCLRMATSDRYRCPSLRSGERIDHDDTVSKRTTQIGYISIKDYVCCECMNGEQFNDGVCKCREICDRKQRRIANMPRYLSSNNNGGKIRRQYDINQDDGRSPLYYDSAVGDMQARWDGRRESTASTEQTPEHDRCASLSTKPTPKPNRSINNETAFLSNQTTPNTETQRPSLSLNTCVDRYRPTSLTSLLSSSSSLRFDELSPITPSSAGSDLSNAWSASSVSDSPLASPITLIDEDVYSITSELGQAVWTEKDQSMRACLDDDHCPLGDIPNSLRDNQFFLAIPRAVPDPWMFVFEPKDYYSWTVSVDTDIPFRTSINMMYTDPSVRDNIPSGFLGSQNSDPLEIKTLAGSAWNTLIELFANTMLKLNEIHSNALADNIRAQSPRDLALTGFGCFRKIITQDSDVTPGPLEYLCLAHLMHAFALTIYGEPILGRCDEFYEQAMSYGEFLDVTVRSNYHQILSTLWQQASQRHERGGFSRNRNFLTRQEEKGKEPIYQNDLLADPLIAAGQNFLDLLENLVLVSDSEEVISSELYAFHYAESQRALQNDSPFVTASNYIAHTLRNSFSEHESVTRKLKVIQQRAQSGYYPTTRKLELELIQAGKGSLTLNEFFERYIPEVRRLCDQIYFQQGTQPRSRYHALGISLVESFASCYNEQLPQGNTDYLSNLPPQYDDAFLHSLYRTFDPYPASSSTQQQINTVHYGSTLGQMSLYPITTTSGLADNTLPKPIFASSDASSTHSESYVVSPAPVSEAYEMRPRQLVRLSPPAQGRMGRGGSVASSLSSSGFTSTGLGSSTQKVEASDCCEICGYRPKGDPQWFKGSMAKHKKMQHSVNPPVIYKCPFPGCNSEYKNRKDNLRQHQIEKNHFVGNENMRRPQKRKKSF